MRRPRSRSVKSCRAALTAAEVRLAAARIESGAAAAPPARDSVMAGFLGRAGMGRTVRRSPLTRQLKPFPARLYLSGFANKKPDRRFAPVPTAADSAPRFSLPLTSLSNKATCRKHSPSSRSNTSLTKTPPASCSRSGDGREKLTPFPAPFSPLSCRRRAPVRIQGDNPQPCWPAKPPAQSPDCPLAKFLARS